MLQDPRDHIPGHALSESGLWQDTASPFMHVALAVAKGGVGRTITHTPASQLRFGNPIRPSKPPFPPRMT